MSKLYELTAKIHKILPKLEKKCRVEIKIKTEYYINESGKLAHIYSLPFDAFDGDREQFDYYPAIQAPQIRQILVDLEGVLKENPEFLTLEKKIENLVDDQREARVTRFLEKELAKTKYTLAEALCQKWLDGLNPLFNRKPEMVLKELLEVLKNLIK